MRFFRTFVISWRGLWSYPVRSLLAILGIAISSLLVVFLLALLYNFKLSLVGQIQSVGAEQIVAVPGRLLNSKVNINNVNLSGLFSFTTMTSTLTYKDAEDVKKQVPEVSEVAPQNEVITNATIPRKNIQVIYTGTTPEYIDMFSLGLEDGRFFTSQEAKNEDPVIVLGQTAKQLLFGDQQAIGKKVRIKGINFTVIGVLKEKQLIGFNFDERVYTSYQMVSDTANLKNASMIFFKASSVNGMESVRQKIARVIEKNHGTDDFGLLQPQGAIHLLDTVTLLVTAIAVGITGVSFLVGGIGIMNVMLLTVKERTREIGIRKAVGAKSGYILLQFLLEATYISSLGCIVGLMASYGLLRWLHHVFPVLSAQMPKEIVVGSLLFSAVLGLIFGIIPALKAIRIRPIDALRYE